ncbi:hypothetical protein [Calothrix rhizosoleniae]|uniref:VHL beta domain-containing protein n=1 Tax=Calothrix rhizosoleniae TaxID=888997 RepID=UPI000B498528|nr:hypothetical protein [Calothrix rhizosoleniae]
MKQIIIRVSSTFILCSSFITIGLIQSQIYKDGVALAASVCPAESESRSISGKVATNVTFANKSSKKVKVYWLDYSGKRTFYKTLKSGTSYKQQTYVTHPWVVTDTSENCLGVYYPDGQARTVEIK